MLYVWIIIIISHHLTGGVDYNYEDKYKDDDYIPVIFPHGRSTSEPFKIVMTDNDDFEEDETFHITIDPLSLPYGTILGSNPIAMVTIKDDERTLLCIHCLGHNCTAYDLKQNSSVPKQFYLTINVATCTM